MKNTNIFVLLGLIAMTGFTVSQAVLASPPGPPPSPNLPNATFNSLTANTSTGIGVYGASADSPGVEGVTTNATSSGVYGYSGSGVGVFGDTVTGVAGRFSTGVSSVDLVNKTSGKALAVTGTSFLNGDAGVNGVLSGTKTTTLGADPTCGSGIGISTGTNCDYPVQVTDNGGLRVLANDPQMPPGWDYNDTRIGSSGISVKTSDGNGLKVDADSVPAGLYHSTFEITHSGVKSWNTSSDLDHTWQKTFDFATGSVMELKNIVWDIYPDGANPATWNRAADLQLDGVTGKITLGANTISLGKYISPSTYGAAVYTQTSSLDTTTAGTLKVNGSLKATGGFGKIYKATGSSTPIGANGYTSASVSCLNATGASDRALSCGFSTGSSNLLVLADTYPGSNNCITYVKNTSATATSFTPYVMCLDPNGTW